MTNPYLEVDKKLLGEIYSSSEPMDNLKSLCDIYGSRFPGTPGDKGSVEYMVDKLKGYGLENAHYETYTIPGWKRGPATLQVRSPVEMDFDVISLPHSIGAEVESELVFLGDGALDVYEERQEEIQDNIVMVTSANPLGMKRFLHRSEKYLRSVLAGAAGWIFMNHYPAYGPPTGGISPIIPAVGISHEDGSYLSRLLEREDEVLVRIKTTDKNLEVETFNVIADVEPSNPVDDEYVVVGSHYDGHDISQGAVDPASGTVTVMEIARNLQSVKDHLKRKVRCICFGAEEIGLYGSYNYSDMHEDELDKCRFMLNLDSGGSEGQKGVIFHDFPELEPKLKRWAKEMNANMPTFQRVSPYSDHWPFFLKSVPCGSGGDPESIRTRTGRGYGHTKYDTVDKVKMGYLRLAAANYIRFLFRVANDDEWNPVRKSQEEIEAFIEEQGYDQTVKLAEKVKDYIRENYEEVHPETKEWLERESNW
ncbi:MAG: M28 family peptidase [Candidatus Bathyarchaeia archaeon]